MKMLCNKNMWKFFTFHFVSNSTSNYSIKSKFSSHINAKSKHLRHPTCGSDSQLLLTKINLYISIWLANMFKTYFKNTTTIKQLCFSMCH